MNALRLHLPLTIAFCAALPVGAIWSFCVLERTPFIGFHWFLSATLSAGMVAFHYLLHFMSRAFDEAPGPENQAR